jgi:hypothetical protein
MIIMIENAIDSRLDLGENGKNIDIIGLKTDVHSTK